jgi:signal peptidase I
MYPTLDNELILLDIFSYKVLQRPCKKGDIVIITDPRNKDQITCKRIAGTAGDVITYRELGTDVVTVIPKGHIWVLGDNPSDSIDSRYFGNVPLEYVKGRVFYRLWPFQSVQQSEDK